MPKVKKAPEAIDTTPKSYDHFDERLRRLEENRRNKVNADIRKIRELLDDVMFDFHRQGRSTYTTEQMADFERRSMHLAHVFGLGSVNCNGSNGHLTSLGDLKDDQASSAPTVRIVGM